MNPLINFVPLLPFINQQTVVDRISLYKNLHMAFHVQSARPHQVYAMDKAALLEKQYSMSYGSDKTQSGVICKLESWPRTLHV